MARTQQEKSGAVRVEMVQVQGPDAIASEEVDAGALSLTREGPPGALVVDPRHVASLPAGYRLGTTDCPIVDTPVAIAAHEDEVLLHVGSALRAKDAVMDLRSGTQLAELTRLPDALEAEAT